MKTSKMKFLIHSNDGNNKNYDASRTINMGHDYIYEKIHLCF